MPTVGEILIPTWTRTADQHLRGSDGSGTDSSPIPPSARGRVARETRQPIKKWFKSWRKPMADGNTTLWIKELFGIDFDDGAPPPEIEGHTEAAAWVMDTRASEPFADPVIYPTTNWCLRPAPWLVKHTSALVLRTTCPTSARCWGNGCYLTGYLVQ